MERIASPAGNKAESGSSRARTMISLVARTASGAFAAILVASAAAPSWSSWLESYTRLTRPAWSARSASILSAVSNSSAATEGFMTR
jgi:hypothetical protein